MNENDIPLPARFLASWIDDNEQFIQLIKARDSINTPVEREKYADIIRIAGITTPCALGAVDAASLVVPFGDLASILIQVVAVDNDGAITLGKPQRATGVDGNELRLATTPMRVASECEFLAQVQQPTIADTSYWSFLMEVNQAITRSEHSSISVLQDAVTRLVDKEAFLNMLLNPMVFPMSKTNESQTFRENMSDRQFLTDVLNAGEYIEPLPLRKGTSGAFGIEKRRFKESEQTEIKRMFDNLAVTFYKPHPWSRAYRIEGHKDKLTDEKWLMSLLNAIDVHTCHNRCVVEPWPQFMADYTAKTLSGVATLYGDMNWYRSMRTYIKTRT
jgi:hypothetical protein